MDDQGIRRVVLAGVLLALTLLLVFTRIGMIPMPTPAGNATIAHIPAIIGGLLEGPLVGLIVGLGFGFASFVNATTPMFKDPMVAILPRLFIGVVAALAYGGVRRLNKRGLSAIAGILLIVLLAAAWQIHADKPILGIVWAVLAVALGVGLWFWLRHQELALVRVGIAAGLGSLTNTVLVLGMAVVRQYMTAPVALVTGLTHGLPEMIVSALITIGVVAAIRNLGGRRKRRPAGTRRSGATKEG
ncbi:MAG: ECF transporter S component [Anaerolineales bacterium]